MLHCASLLWSFLKRTEMYLSLSLFPYEFPSLVCKISSTKPLTYYDPA